MKKLPKIYQAEINKTIKNNKKLCYLKNEDIKVLTKQSKNDIDSLINEVFSSLGQPYNISLNIKTKDKEYQTSLISKTKTKLVTLDNEVIPISEIIAIKKN